MLQYSFTDKIGNAVDLLQNRVDSRRSVKAIALYSRLLTAGTGTTPASFLCRFFHNFA